MIELIREQIGILVNNGFVNGFYPDWKIKYSGISGDKISEYTRSHIAEHIKQGFVQGEIQECNTSGWWRLTVD